MAENPVSDKLVYCVACITAGESHVVHIFSTWKKRQDWVATHQDDYESFIHYDYVIDDPDRMETKRTLS